MPDKERVIFVDDDPKILDGLRRMLRPMREQWVMSFAGGGEEALEIINSEGIDVIVSDMRMPEMNGAELMHRVKEICPKSVRLILSGQSDHDLILQAVGATHQFLHKPSKANQIISAITRSVALRDLLNNKALQTIVTHVDSLPSLPENYHNLVAEIQSPAASVRRVGKIISEDIGMSAKILQLVNSAFFGLPREISNPELAASLLGLDTIVALTLSIRVFSQFDDSAMDQFPLERIWEHSLESGKYAKAIALSEKPDSESVEETFISGVFHDIGKIVLSAHFSEKYAEVLEIYTQNDLSLHEAEVQVLGTSHGEIGAYLLGLWGLPDTIVEAVAFHNDPSRCPNPQFGVLTAVHVANAFEHAFEVSDDLSTLKGLDMDYLAKIGMDHRLPEWWKICQALDKRKAQS